VTLSGAQLSMAKIGNATAKSSSTSIFPEYTKVHLFLFELDIYSTYLFEFSLQNVISFHMFKQA